MGFCIQNAAYGKEDPKGVVLGSFEGCVQDEGKSDGAPLATRIDSPIVCGIQDLVSGVAVMTTTTTLGVVSDGTSLLETMETHLVRLKTE